jgi:hypothetical protein
VRPHRPEAFLTSLSATWYEKVFGVMARAHPTLNKP